MERTELINRIFDARQRRCVHPQGYREGFRWYPSRTEHCDCCDSVRNPSRTFPWSLMVHCRSRVHVTQLVDTLGSNHKWLLAQAVCGENREQRAAVQQARACAEGAAYKSLAVVDGQLVSIFDGSPWPLRGERRQRPRQNHGGGFYVYETPEQARACEVPETSAHADAPRVVVRCEVSGSYCRYDNGKLAWGRVRPIEIVAEINQQKQNKNRF